MPIRVFKTAPASLRVLFEEAVSDKPFIVYDDERLTFAEAYETAAKIAWLLRTDYGVGKGDRVAISMRNYPEWVCAFMAVTSLGAIAVAMNALWRPDEMAYGLTDSGACVLFADQERLDRLAQCEARPPVRVIAVRGRERFAGGAEPRRPPAWGRATRACRRPRSSPTDGRPPSSTRLARPAIPRAWSPAIGRS